MKRQWLLLIVGLALVVGIVPAQAANLANASGQSCGTFDGTWHFVNNQTGGASDGVLTAHFLQGNGAIETCVVTPSKNTGSTQHFYCTGYSGTLSDASTTLPGRLVLSDFSCSNPPPPKCDPKTDPNGCK